MQASLCIKKLTVCNKVPVVKETQRERERSCAYVQFTSDRLCKRHVPGIKTSARVDAVPATACFSSSGWHLSRVTQKAAAQWDKSLKKIEKKKKKQPQTSSALQFHCALYNQLALLSVDFLKCDFPCSVRGRSTFLIRVHPLLSNMWTF